MFAEDKTMSFADVDKYKNSIVCFFV